VLTLLAKLEALARAVFLTIRVSLDGVFTDSHRARASRAICETPIITIHAAAGLVFRFAATPGAIAPVKAFIIVVVSTIVPYEIHNILQRVEG